MIHPLALATDGYLCGNTLSVATNGYICIEEEVPIIRNRDTGGGHGTKDKPINKRNVTTTDWYAREEDDVLLILKLFLQCQN